MVNFKLVSSNSSGAMSTPKHAPGQSRDSLLFASPDFDFQRFDGVLLSPADSSTHRDPLTEKYLEVVQENIGLRKSFDEQGQTIAQLETAYLMMSNKFHEAIRVSTDMIQLFHQHSDKLTESGKQASAALQKKVEKLTTFRVKAESTLEKFNKKAGAQQATIAELTARLDAALVEIADLHSREAAPQLLDARAHEENAREIKQLQVALTNVLKEKCAFEIENQTLRSLVSDSNSSKPGYDPEVVRQYLTILEKMVTLNDGITPEHMSIAANRSGMPLLVFQPGRHHDRAHSGSISIIDESELDTALSGVRQGVDGVRDIVNRSNVNHPPVSERRNSNDSVANGNVELRSRGSTSSVLSTIPEDMSLPSTPVRSEGNNDRTVAEETHDSVTGTSVTSVIPNSSDLGDGKATKDQGKKLTRGGFGKK